MNAKRICLALIITGLLATVVGAQVQLRGAHGNLDNSTQAAGANTDTQARAATQIKAADNKSAAPADKDANDDDRLVGSWRATFTPVSGDPAQFPPLPALFTFTSDGTLVETDGGSLVPFMGTFGSPGHGVWRSLGKHRFELKNIILVVNSDGTLFLTGTVHLTLRVSADGNSFQGNGTFSFVDANGVDFGSGPENISGQRIKLN